jgi:hypothetical protein
MSWIKAFFVTFASAVGGAIEAPTLSPTPLPLIVGDRVKATTDIKYINGTVPHDFLGTVVGFEPDRNGGTLLIVEWDGLLWASNAPTLRGLIQKVDIDSSTNSNRVVYVEVYATSDTGVTCAIWHNGARLGTQICSPDAQGLNHGASCIQAYLTNGDLTQVCDGSTGEGAFQETHSICELYGNPRHCCQVPDRNGFFGLKMVCIGSKGTYLDAPNTSRFTSCSRCAPKEDSIDLAQRKACSFVAIAIMAAVSSQFET